MSIVAHLSDLHFGRQQPAIIDALLSSLHNIEPDLVIISGDLTQRAKHREFHDARRFLDKLHHPYMVVPGNHDLSAHRLIERFFYPWRKWQRYISADLEPVAQYSHLFAVGINTARRFGFYLDWSRGRINQRQAARIQQEFDMAPADCLRLVVAHHPFWLPENSLHRRLIGGRDAALKVFADCGVDLILGGHVHLAYAELVEGVIISHAGTTVSSRLIDEQPNSFNVITGNRCDLSLEHLEWDGRMFRPVAMKSFRRVKESWQ